MQMLNENLAQARLQMCGGGGGRLAPGLAGFQLTLSGTLTGRVSVVATVHVSLLGQGPAAAPLSSPAR